MDRRCAVIDFETEGIQPRPAYPPKPVGVAIEYPDMPPLYFAWGHPTGNGIYALVKGKLEQRLGDPLETAKAMLYDAYKIGVIGHNIFKFDLDVAQTHLGLTPPPWHLVHDTLFSLFLKDPHATSLSLKPSAERYLNLPPTERDEVFDWLADHGVIAKPRIRDGVLCYPKDAGAYIGKAPGAVVAAYAIGDLTRTKGLHNLLHPQIVDSGMGPAYDRERRLAPILLENERLGMRVDMRRLEKDLPLYEQHLTKVENWLRKQLKDPILNLDSDEETARALKRSGIVKEFPKTATGKDSVSKKNLTMKFYSDPLVYGAMVYRNSLDDVIKKNLRPWYIMGAENHGYIFTEWNQVRGQDAGARSGRVTCTWFANIVKQFVDRKGGDYTSELDARVRGEIGLESLPKAREFCLPDEYEYFGHVDYNQQELRLVAHYEEGQLAKAYVENPATDIHEYVQNLMRIATGKLFPRDFVKLINFRTVYGGGVAGLAEMLGISFDSAQEMINAWRVALPGVVELDKTLKRRFYEGRPLRTYGGRLYHCKPPTVAKKGPRKGEMITYEYTALNYLIQPSGADVTKEALIRYHEHPKRRGRLLTTVYDEINISMPDSHELAVLQESMESVKLDVPWQTKGKVGTSWGNVE